MHGNPYKLCIYSLLLQASTLVQGVTYQDIEHAFDTLQTWYDPGKGVWMPSTGWWNSANCLTTLANLAEIDPNINNRTQDLWNQSFTNAQLLNADMTAGNGARWSLAADIRPQKRSQFRAFRRGNDPGFLNDFYDDEGWWALAWIRVFDLTNDSKYLDAAVQIFDDMHAAYGMTPVGGLWWDKGHSYVNAIANELHFSVAAHLANRCPSQRHSYTSIAEQTLYWLYGSGMITSSGNIKDGLPIGRMPGNTEIVWSYNQGVILSALTELARATSTNQYIDIARYIADAALSNLTAWKDENPNMILREPCEGWGDCGRDGASFKGIFARNLAHLHSVCPQRQYADFLKQNAESLWCNSRDQYNRLGLSWSGPFEPPANASTQCSGMDVLVGALSQLGEW